MLEVNCKEGSADLLKMDGMYVNYSRYVRILKELGYVKQSEDQDE